MKTSRILLLIALTIAPVALAATDVLTVGSVSAPAGTVRVPVYVRDLSATRLGVDRPAGERIQAVGFRVSFSPAHLVSSASFARAGALLRTPLFEHNAETPGGGSLSFLASFAESNNALPFGSNAAAPGTLIGHLSLTTSASAGATITIALDEELSILSNQGGTITETFANNGLTLQNGIVTIASGSCPAIPPVAASLSGVAGACAASTGGTASVPAGPADWTYQWGWRSTPAGATAPIIGATSPSYTINGSDFGGPGTKYLVATVHSSCAGPAVSNALQIAITTAPIVTLSAGSAVFASSPDNFASVPEAPAGATYAWSITNGTITAGQGTSAIRYTAGASGQVSLGVVVTQSGCSGSANLNANVTIRSRPAGATMFYAITPCRMVDTRNPNGPYGGPIAQSGSERMVQATGVCGIPEGAKSIIVNVTAVAPAASGILALYPSGAWPGTATVNYRSGRTRASSAAVTLSGGWLTVKNIGPSVHYIIDVTGYFR